MLLRSFSKPLVLLRRTKCSAKRKCGVPALIGLNSVDNIRIGDLAGALLLSKSERSSKGLETSVIQCCARVFLGTYFRETSACSCVCSQKHRRVSTNFRFANFRTQNLRFCERKFKLPSKNSANPIGALLALLLPWLFFAKQKQPKRTSVCQKGVAQPKAEHGVKGFRLSNFRFTSVTFA